MARPVRASGGQGVPTVRRFQQCGALVRRSGVGATGEAQCGAGRDRVPVKKNDVRGGQQQGQVASRRWASATTASGVILNSL